MTLVIDAMCNELPVNLVFVEQILDLLPEY
jgi:hypothetical protein